MVVVRDVAVITQIRHSSEVFLFFCLFVCLFVLGVFVVLYRICRKVDCYVNSIFF